MRNCYKLREFYSNNFVVCDVNEDNNFGLGLGDSLQPKIRQTICTAASLELKNVSVCVLCIVYAVETYNVHSHHFICSIATYSTHAYIYSLHSSMSSICFASYRLPVARLLLLNSNDLKRLSKKLRSICFDIRIEIESFPRKKYRIGFVRFWAAVSHSAEVARNCGKGRFFGFLVSMSRSTRRNINNNL